ncbi:transcriptional regulator, TetR family [Flavobacterium akiainvivens]|nr:transcriptional regulator, TetR family [Flavobacterium akiainvivens]
MNMSGLILEKAKEMYLNLGFKGVTLDDIAQEMSISKKTIYQHYANKNELVEAVGTYLMQIIFDEIQKIAASGCNAVEELFEIRKYLRRTLEDKYRLAAYQLTRFFPEISQKMHMRQFDRMKESVSRNLQRGISEGLYRTDINVDFVSRIYFTGISGTKDSSVFPEELFNTNDLHNLYLEYHLRAICTPKGILLAEKYLTENKE